MTQVDKRAILEVLMKRTLGTLVLFVLLILTVVALTQLDVTDTSALNDRTASHAVN